MVASDIASLIDPTTANGITAALFGFFAMGAFVSPKQFLHGTKWPAQKPWFNPKLLPQDATAPLYQLLKFFSIVQMTTVVVPIIVEPHSQFMTYFVAIGAFLNLIHQIIFLIGIGPYKDVAPSDGKGQWIFGCVMSVAAIAVNVIASLHDQCHTPKGVPYVLEYYTGAPHILPTLPINIVLCAFGAINGIQLLIAPTHFGSTWFGAPKADIPSDFKAKKFMGFDVMPENGAFTFFARNMGLHFLALSIVCAVTPVDGVSNMFYHPMYTLIGLLFFTAGGAQNLHALQLQDQEGTTAKHYKMTYVPQTIISVGIAVVCLLALVRHRTPDLTAAQWKALEVTDERAEEIGTFNAIWDTHNETTGIPYGLDTECFVSQAEATVDQYKAVLTAELGADSPFVKALNHDDDDHDDHDH